MTVPPGLDGVAPVWPGKAVGDVRSVGEKCEFDRRPGSWGNRLELVVRQEIDAGVVAVTAINVIDTSLALALFAVTGCLMRMFMMAKMLRRLAGFMLTIVTRRRPRHLERYRDQQKNKKQAFHECGL